MLYKSLVCKLSGFCVKLLTKILFPTGEILKFGMFMPQLPAGGGDIAAARHADGGVDS